MTYHKPFLLSPAAKDYLWGGNRLRDGFCKNIDISLLAETLEYSTHPNGPSIISRGEYKGISLTDFISKHPHIVGYHPTSSKGKIPILVKFIDAKANLSIQVHPSDEYAQQHGNGQLGKTEMWFMLSKVPFFVYGFQRQMTKELVKSSALDGSIEKYMHKVPIKKNDVFIINSGTIHALGAGALIAEIQDLLISPIDYMIMVV